MKPYKFEPYLKTTIWGGYQIAPFKGIFNAQPNVGESWEISGVPGHESVAINRGLVNDVDEGLTLVELIDKYKELLVGKKIYKKFGNQFPLLVKFIDSRQDLSVQVHPDDKLAMERHGCAGKTEMWYTYFVVHRVVVQVAQQIDFHCDSFVIVVCLWGNANINGIEIRQGETILVPACENILYIFGNATFLTATM